MDEILASIRKIIADDTSPSRPGTRRAPVEALVAERSEGTAEAKDGRGEPPSPANDDAGAAASLLSAPREAEAAAAFATLNHTVFSKNARTIEDVVQDMLRPMLQTWLDAHLPTLVERLVRQEIERISGKP
ncbi:hypothetical protein LMIY3S_01817 [Labrys miyagiensis]